MTSRAMIAIMLLSPIAQLLSRSDCEVSLDDGAHLFTTGEAVRFLFIVRQGSVQMLRRHAHGAVIVLQRVLPDGLVAEASLFAQRYHCDAVVEGRTVLARIPKVSVLENCLTDTHWLQGFAAHLASEVRRARSRAELLSLKRVDERLDAWFILHGNEMPPRGRWINWANELGVSAEALYRELAKRRE